MSKPTKRKSKLLKQQDKPINGTAAVVAANTTTTNATREAWRAAWDSMGLDALMAPAALGTDRVGDTDQFRMPLQAPVSAQEAEEPLRHGSANVAPLSGAQEAESKTACNTYSDVAAILAAANEPLVADANLSASIVDTHAASSFDLSKRPSGLRVVEGSERAFSSNKFRPADYLEAMLECHEYLNFAGNEKLIHALALASVGLRVFLAVPFEKRPLVKDWQNTATSDSDSIVQWFSGGHANVAVATGATDGGFELVVVDVDTKHGAVGFEGLHELEETLGKLPETLTAITPSGCKHLYYRARGGLGVASRKLKTAEGFDVGDFQAAGKLVIAPPSVFADPDDGYKHKPYKWANDLPIAELPDAWIAPSVARVAPKYPSINDSDAGTLISGQDALDALATLDHISPDIGYEDWKDVTALLHNVEGGHEAWLSWTQRGEKFRDGDEAKWDQVASMQLASAGSVAKLFAMASKNPSYVNPKSRQAQHHSDVPEGVRYVDGSEEAFGSSIDLAITTESLLHGIHQAGADAWQRTLKGSKELRHSAAWFASGVLDGGQGKVLAYQTMYPTTSKGHPRKLVIGDRINWPVAVYTAAMHIAGDVVIQNGNKHVSNFSELTQESKDQLTNQVVELFEASKIKGVWDVPATAGTMRDTITNAVRAFKIKSNSAKTASNKTDTLPAATVAPATPATPAVYAGFDLSRPPDTLTGKANGFVSGGVVAPPAAMGVSVPVQAAVEAPSAALVDEITAALKYKLHESESHLRKCVDGSGAEHDWHGGKLYGLLTGNIAWMQGFCIRYPVRGDGNAIGWFTQVGEVDYDNAVYAACHEQAKIALPQHIEDGEERKVRYDSARKAIIEQVKAAGVQGVMMWSLAKCHGDTGKMNEWLVNKKISKCLSDRITRLAALDAEAKRLQTESLSRDVALKARIAAGEYHVNLMQKLKDLYAKPWNETAHMAGETDFSVPLTDEAEFLHYSKGKYVRPLCTPENVALLLGYYGCRARHNEMRHMLEYEGFGIGSGDHEGALNKLYSIVKRNNLKWELGDVDRAFNEWAGMHKFHPVKEWIETKPWDGVSRIEALADTITVDVGQRDMWLIYLRRWMLGAVNALYSEVGGASKHMLVLQGEQSKGKTSWFRKLCGGNPVYKDGVMLDVKNKDSVRETLTWWLVELGELEATYQTRQIAELKAFVTKQADEWRDPFARRQNVYPRRTAFVGTVNKDEPLADFTGNTRFATVTAEKIDYTHNIDMQQVWAEVLSIWLNGTSEEKRHWLTREEEAQMERLNERYVANGVAFDYVALTFDWSDRGKAEMQRAYEVRDRSYFMTAAEIFQLLEAVGYKVNGQGQKNEVANALAKLGAIKHKGTGGVRGYYLPKINPKATPAR